MPSRRLQNLIHLSLVLALSAALALGTASQASAATIWYVNAATGSDSHSGTSWATAFKTLQKAVSTASSGQQIWVAKGTYTPTARPFWPSDPRGATFLLNDGVAVYGGFAGTETSLSQRNWKANLTILSGDIGTVGDASDNAYEVVSFQGAGKTAILDGFKITGGNATCGCLPGEAGGGVFLWGGASPTLRNLIISKNWANIYGGGLFSNGGSPALTNVTFSGNSADSHGGGMYNGNGSSPSLTNVLFSKNKTVAADGGAMYNEIGSSPKLSHVTFSGNASANDGGGMYNANSSPTLAYVTFTGNTAARSGGGMLNVSSSPTLMHVSFAKNLSASDGGGMYNNSASPSLTNVAFSGNKSSNNGGGMYNTASGPSLAHVTFQGNTASANGGGIYNTANSSPAITNVTLTGNAASASGGGIYSDSGSPTLNRVTFSSNTATSNGGGIYNDSFSDPSLTNAAFTGNSAGGEGGGIYNGSTFTLTDATFSKNAATNYGGGIFNNNNNPTLSDATFGGNTASAGAALFNANGSPSLTNTTFSGNVASANGGAMFNFTGSPLVYDSIFWADSPQEIMSGGMTLTDSLVQGGCPSGPTCTNVQNQNPKLGLLQNNGGFTQTMALGAGSAAIDAGGSNSSCASADQRGVSRPQGLACDIGAYEVRTEYFASQAAYDGYVRESGQGSGLGGSVYNTGTTFLAGDDATNRRYYGFLSFNTDPIPDTATIVKAQLSVMQQNISGTPFSNNVSLVADLANPYFGSNLSLESSDWQATTNVFNSVASFGSIPVPNFDTYAAWLNSSGRAQINKAGTTQFRLRFSGPDAFSGAADYLTLYSGELGAPFTPALTVYYNP